MVLNIRLMPGKVNKNIILFIWIDDSPRIGCKNCNPKIVIDIENNSNFNNVEPLTQMMPPHFTLSDDLPEVPW